VKHENDEGGDKCLSVRACESSALASAGAGTSYTNNLHEIKLLRATFESPSVSLSPCYFSIPLGEVEIVVAHPPWVTIDI